jgi:hypothetical protein
MKKLVNFRLSKRALAALRAAIQDRQRSKFIRQAIDHYLTLPKAQNLDDRPHIRGFEPEFEQVAALIPESSLQKLREIYPNVSSSVVIEAAIMYSLELLNDNADTSSPAN